MNDWWSDEVERLARQVEELRARIDYAAAAKAELRVPSLAEFVVGVDFLAQPKIYPRQLTILRIVFCDLDGLTEYDKAVIAEWGSGFVRPPLEPGTARWLWEPAPGRNHVMGTTGDLLERMAELRTQGRRWFREANLVFGRRGGKGHLGALKCSRLVWELLALGDPQLYFGIPRNKRIIIPIFAGNHEQARFNLFADIATTIIDAPCFAPYLAKLYRDRLVIATPADLARPDRPFEGSIEIVAKEATGNAGRGPGALAQFYDEMAWVDPATSSASAEVVYSAATPALDQFSEWAFISELSSPYQQTGEFFEIHCRAREIDPYTGRAAYPEVFTLQLPSWAPYEDHDRATEIPMVTDAEAATSPALRDAHGRPRCFPPTGRPITANDHQMRQLERARPVEFARERLAQWGTVGDPYLNPAYIPRIFGPYKGEILHPREAGNLSVDYTIVVDPAVKHDAFAWAIGHREPADEEGRPHVVVDLNRRWLPADHGGELPLTSVLDQLEADVRFFRATQVITDQYGGGFVRQDLNRRLYQHAFAGFSVVREQPRSRDRNLATAALFREAVYLGQVHCYPDPQLERELRFLQEASGKVAAPTSGPTQTDDVAVAVMVLVEELLGSAASQPVHDALAHVPLAGRPRLVTDPVTQALFDQLGNPYQRGSQGQQVGERAYPGGPRRMPRWAGGR